MPKSKIQNRRPLLMVPRLEYKEITALRVLARARLRRMVEHIKAGRFEAAKRDRLAIETMATLHPEVMLRSV